MEENKMTVGAESRIISFGVLVEPYQMNWEDWTREALSSWWKLPYKPKGNSGECTHGANAKGNQITQA